MWSTTSSTERSGVTVRSTFSTVMLRSLTHAVARATNRSNAAAPFTRPNPGWCSSGSPANEPISAWFSPDSRPAKYGTATRFSRRRSASTCSSTGAEKSSGSHGTPEASHMGGGARLLSVVQSRRKILEPVDQVADPPHGRMLASM